MQSFIDGLKFDEKGLISTIIQDAKTKEVLMFAFMNRESVEITLKEKKCCYYSRSRKKLWLKGETSGNFQVVKKIQVDCDQDCLLISVEQKGGACHEGFRSCFFRTLNNDQLEVTGEKLFDPGKVYNK